ncbi:MAG: glycoside hydrolase family 3 C-terminal domain-containing protein [Bacteroidales bacterium]|nr:glycoside hydrolase family 3 C-terminal domain-containing protein [Bacteroidales bacterium]
MKKKLLIVLGLWAAISLWGQQYPYQNPNLSSEERAKDLISRLTLEEKAALMCDISDAIPRLDIKKFNWWSEALHGLANNSNVTVFPQPIGMAASFDDQLVYRIFNAVSDETRAKYNEARQNGEENRRFLSLSVWTPNINIVRDPRWGRGQETYGEDPYLTSRMGISVVKGLQGPDDSRYNKLLACAKHYAVHSGPEWSRHTLNVNNVDPRDLWETYLPAFKSLVQDANVREVMCAYQRLDDEPCCGSTRLLQRILRDEWGFKYLVVSDCGAISDFYNTHKVSSDQVHAAAKGVLAGTDVECAGPSYKKLPEAVQNGLLGEEDINKSMMRILVGRFDLGEMDNDTLVPWAKIPVSIVNCDEHKKMALEMARETMTLLQNRNNILPLSRSVNAIAVTGPNADDERLMWGNYNGIPFNTITILDGIKSKLPAEKIVHDRGCDLVEKMVIESVIHSCSIDGKAGIKATYWNNREFTGDAVTTLQITDPLQLTTEGQHEFAPGVNLQDFSGKYETVYKPSESGELVFKFEAGGLFDLIVNADTLYKPRRWGPRINRIPINVEKGQEYKIEARFRQIGRWPASLSLNFGREIPVEFDELIEKLKGIDVVIFAGGISSRLEGEQMPIELPGFKGGDRTDIELPEIQRNCLKALKQAGKKVIFVNCSGSAMGLVPETESCDAILQAWYGGESGGQAVADVLFGDYNPSGKLPITFYKNIQQLPDFEDYSMKGRTYRFMSDPLFPFGFGLSYTTFSVGNARFSKKNIQAGETIELTVPVTNTGKRDGTEIIQVYIHKVNDTDGPLKTLRGFKRVDVAAGKTGNAVISLPGSSFEFFDRLSGKMTVAAGEYEVHYGTSSDAKDLKTEKILVQ